MNRTLKTHCNKSKYGTSINRQKRKSGTLVRKKEGAIPSKYPPKLPIIRVGEIRKIEMEEVDLELEDNLFYTIVNHGRDVATDKDLFQIGFIAMLTETVERELGEGQSCKTKKKRRSNSP